MPKLETEMIEVKKSEPLEKKSKRSGKAWYSLALLIGFVLLCVFIELPPKPVAEHAPESEFSAVRAFAHIEAIAQKPHPTGSLENEKVRQYLVDQLEQLGLHPKVEHSHYLENRYDFVDSVEVYNVIGSIKGSGGGKQVVLMAHYDSVPSGPGANDNGVAVAALLEVAKILQSESQPKNDLLFVFTDAEEMGLIGAEEFWAEPARVEETGLVLNFEARGSKGASLMFQTSPQNDWLIQEFAKVAPNPVTSSLLSSFYETMPNDTDLTVTIEAGLPSINFAYGQGWTAYHSMMDNMDNVDLRTLQHHGENALSLARHFSQIDLNNQASQNRIFFSLFGQVIHYSEKLVVPFTLFLIVLYLAVFILAKRKKLFSFAQLGFGFLVLGISLIGSIIVALPVWFAVNKLWAHRMSLFAGGLHDSLLYNLSFLVLTAGLCFLMWSLFKRKLNRWAFVFSVMVLWLVILAGLTLYLKGATYLFAIPLLISLLVMGAALLRPQPDQAIRHPLAFALLVSVPVMLFTSVFQLFYSFLPVDLNVYLNLFVVLFLALLYIPLSEIGTAFRWTPAVSLGIAIVLLGASWVLASPSEQRQVNSNLFYALDSQTGEAQWVSLEPPNSWTQQYISGENLSILEDVMPGAGGRTIWTGEAPVVSVAKPEVSIVEQTIVNGERTLHLNIKTVPHTRVLYLVLPNTTAASIQLGEKVIPVMTEGESLYIKQTGLPPEGLTFLIRGPAEEELELVLTEVQDQAVEELANVWLERPVELIPGGSFDGSMLIQSHYKFYD